MVWRWHFAGENSGEKLTPHLFNSQLATVESLLDRFQ